MHDNTTIGLTHFFFFLHIYVLWVSARKHGVLPVAKGQKARAVCYRRSVLRYKQSEFIFQDFMTSFEKLLE